MPDVEASGEDRRKNDDDVDEDGVARAALIDQESLDDAADDLAHA